MLRRAGLLMVVATLSVATSTAAPYRPTPFAAAPVEAAPSRAPSSYVLALSWEPAFCESASRKLECRSQTAARADARQLSLHGLWPEAEYCGVAQDLIALDEDGSWMSLPSPKLSRATAARLASAMPGTQSGLDRHEWLKHGTCSGLAADGYFSRALDLADAFNTSPAGALFGSRMGRQLRSVELVNAINASFGPATGKRLTMTCRRDGSRNLVEEITLSLDGNITSGSLSDLLSKAPPSSAQCRSGIVDPAGLQ